MRSDQYFFGLSKIKEKGHTFFCERSAGRSTATKMGRQAYGVSPKRHCSLVCQSENELRVSKILGEQIEALAAVFRHSQAAPETPALCQHGKDAGAISTRQRCRCYCISAQHLQKCTATRWLLLFLHRLRGPAVCLGDALRVGPFKRGTLTRVGSPSLSYAA